MAETSANDISISDIKSQMKSLKIELKAWEHEFLEGQGRKPTKDDILKDKTIAKKYKLYSKFKAKFSETGQDATEDLNQNGSIRNLDKVYLESKLSLDGGLNAEIRASANNLDALNSKKNELSIAQAVVFRSSHPFLKTLSFLPANTEVAPVTRKRSLTVTSESIRYIDNPLKQNVPLKDPSLFKRIPLGLVLRCKILRKDKGIDGRYPTYYLLNEADDKFLMVARKRKKAKNPRYLISSDIENITKDSKGYIAKIKGENNGLLFTVLDARDYSPNDSKKGMRDLAAICYDKGEFPRSFKAAIRPTNISEDSKIAFSENIMSDLLTDAGNVLILTTSKPVFDKNRNAYGLNFGGRVTEPSIKNFQLVDPVQNNSLTMQFGRTGPDSFSLDCFYPLTPVEAFSIALTSFDAYLSTT